ncbi:helix-turn-helix domain-containing protein [Ruminiclostridium cellobioparum]|jgi:transcriptional regulator with XRE-family HTH domain|uniref:DNA-binding protein n=1 Tax=Ruminiclostridium cellobioparum subsp. termitidis CT1112 TaxID=1195236 RepID=S0FLM5_RUMCE|nr:XRE family transcriptional regulator [Ruminiclostridium cellobioparum]EMS73135.1 DNA-binding protein [Ruminiclostridium cellobioparum subsp. termitidis CT1112]
MFSEIGSKINRLRLDKKLTLKELSQLTNLSVGFLSQLERGLTTVAIDSLDNISKALGVDINYFFTLAKEQNSFIQKSYEREIVFMDKDNFIQFHLSNSLGDKNMFPRLVEVYPKRDNETVLTYTHEGEEFIYILEGILTYYYDGEKTELYPGDSVHIRSTLSHNWENNTNKIVKLLMVSTPNRFHESQQDAPAQKI